MKDLERLVLERIKNRADPIDRRIHPSSSYAQAVRGAVASGEITLDEVQRVFPDTDFLTPLED